jgi:uncharacterized membrane protein
MASYTKRLERDVERWIGLGLIDGATAQALIADAKSHERRSLSFGSVLMMMAALLFCAAILLLVAANWEAMPRLARVGMLFAVIAAGYVGGAFLKMRGHGALAEGAWLIAASAFGGAIALIGQMYHLSGDEEAAILTWCAGTALAAAALRSGPLTVGATAIAVSWMVTEGFDIWGRGNLPLFYPVVALALWMVSLWTGSVAARHLILLSLIAYAVLLSDFSSITTIGVCLAVVSGLIFAASVLAAEQVERIVRLNGRLPLHGLIGFLVGAAMLQVEHADEAVLLIIIALVVFAAVAAAILMAGRESRALRWVAYLGFFCELAFLYVATIGTMLGTAGLFLASGLVLGLVAFIIIRIERRLGGGREATI